MQVLDVIRQAGGGAAVDTLARSYGVRPEQAEAVIAAVLPEVARRIERQTLSRGGIADVLAALSTAGSSGVLDDPSRLAGRETQVQGIGFLDQILGSKDASRAVASRAARASGLGESLVQQMLPIIISMIMGAIAKGAQGGLGDILARIPGMGGGAQPAGGRPAGGGFDSPRGGSRNTPGGGPGGAMPDLSLPGPGNTGGFGDGGFGGGRSGSGSPLPMPGESPSSGSNPYGDLSDMIRRSGTSVGTGGTGGMVRDLLGGLLGFQSRGVVGWIVRFIVMRWGWGLLKMVLSRMMGRR